MAGPSNRNFSRNTGEKNIGRAMSSLVTDVSDSNVIDLTGLIHRTAKAIRAQQPVNWIPYLEAELISEGDYTFLTSLQNAKTKEERDNILKEFEDDAYHTLTKIIHRICIVEEIQKFLVLVDDMLREDISRVHRFFQVEPVPWNNFMDLLSCSDEFVRNLSSRIITRFITVADYTEPKSSEITYFLNWLKYELRYDNKYLLNVGRCLQKLLRNDEYRILFINLNGIFRIIRLLYAGIKPQAQYRLIFCIWLASYNVEIAEKLNNYSCIPVLFDLLEACPAEILKLPRIIVAVFRNLLEKPREEGIKKHNALVMIQCKVFKFIDIIKIRLKSLADPEFFDDFAIVETILNKYVDELSTFDEYKLEVKSGRLEWSVVHTSKPFWDENALRLNENKYELLKKLISLLDESQESTVLCVAVHDLGEYMSRFPWGKKLVEEFGGKDALLKLLSHEHPVVKYHALKTLQILMLNNYDLLVRYISNSRTFDGVEPRHSLRDQTES